MINNYFNNKLNNLFSEIFTFGIRNDYSLDAVGDYIASSNVIFRLENNDDSFIFEYSSEEIIKEIYRLKEIPTLEKYNLVIADWLSMIYLEIFFEFKKSFGFIFLYFPISRTYEMFDVYHEMDVTHVYEYFDKEINKINLFPKILKYKGYTTKQLSVLSGININTLNGYSKSNQILYGASNRNIKLISQILNVRSELFLEHLFISQSSGDAIFAEEKEQLVKDSVLFLNTSKLLKNIEFYKDKSPTYDELISLINDFALRQNNKLLAVTVNDINIINKCNLDVFLVSDKEVKSLNRNIIKEIPSIVKEYALIKADIRSYRSKN